MPQLRWVGGLQSDTKNCTIHVPSLPASRIICSISPEFPNFNRERPLTPQDMPAKITYSVRTHSPFLSILHSHFAVRNEVDSVLRYPCIRARLSTYLYMNTGP